MTQTKKMLWAAALACALALALILAIDAWSNTGTGAQEAPPPTTCNAEGACVLVEDPPVLIVDEPCDQHAGDGSCLVPPPVPKEQEPAYTG